MEHQFYLDRLSAYFDQELKNEEHAIVHEHVQSCDECQKKLHELEKLENLITENTNLSENDYWELSAQKIESAITHIPKTEIIDVKKVSSSGLWWKLAGVAASLVLVAIFSLEQKDSGIELRMQDSDKMTNEITAPVVKEELSDEQTEIQEVETAGKQDKDNKDESTVGRVEEKIEKPVIAQANKLDKLAQNPEPSKTTTDQNPPAEQDNLIPKQPGIDKPKTKSVQSVVTQESSEIVKQVLQPTEVVTADSDEKKIASAKETTKKSRSTLSTDAFQAITPLTKGTDTGTSISKLSDSFSEAVPSNNYAGIAQTAPQKSSTEDTELEYWRRKVTGYTEDIKIPKSNSVRFQKKPAGSEKKETTNDYVDKDLTYKQLFEAYYHVAILTTDSIEEKQSVQFLTNYADSLTKSYSSNALHYLQLYKNEKTKKIGSNQSTD